MKLKEGIVIDRCGNDCVAVAVGETNRIFSGMLRGNGTLEFILQQLHTDTTEDAVAAAMTRIYDVSDDVALQDVRRVVGQLREIGLIDD